VFSSLFCISVPCAVPKFWPGYFSPTEDGIEIYWKVIMLEID